MKDAYTNLLAHLHRAESTAPLEAIRQSLSFHLANATSPGPTSLAATAITSPLFLSGSFDLDRLTAFSLAFRHAVNIKSNASGLTQWTKFILKGLQGGHLLLRLAAVSGLLLGLEDIKAKSNVVTQVQDRLVIDFAQVMDREWESEFYQRTSVLNDSPSAQGPGLLASAAALELPLSKAQKNSSQVLPSILISVILISHSLPLIPPPKLQALPLQALSGVLTEGIVGVFVEYLESSHHSYGSNSASESANVLPLAAAAISSNVLRQHIPTLARLLSLFFSLLLNSKPKEGLVCAQESLNKLERIAVKVESEPGSESEKNEVGERVDVESKEEEEESKIKTLLFTHVMLADSILSACLYISPSSYLAARRTPASTTSASPASLSLTTLQTLFHLSRVVSEFGGISSMNTPSEEGGEFKELKRVAYLALDILAHASSNRADSEKETAPTSTLAERFVDELCFSLPSPSVLNVTTRASSNLITLSKTSFALSCIEQLVPVLSMRCLGGSVWRAVEPFLYLDPATRNGQGGTTASDTYRHHLDQLKRETFESAHSVVLAMFAANANENGNGNDAVPKPSSRAAGTPSTDRNSGSGSDEVFLTLAAFCERLVPFYAKCLIENSSHDKLSTTQLRIAYPALVRSASTSSNASDSDPESSSQFVLAWYCIDELLGAIRNTNTNTNSDLGSDRKQEREKEREQEQEHRHRLHLTLISCVSALPLPLLARVLEEIGGILQARDQGQTRPNQPQETHTAPDQNERHRMELIQALYYQVLEVVGDREKEYVLRWWSAFAQAANSNEAGIAEPPLGSLTARL